MRRHDQVIVLDRQVVNGSGRKVELKRSPVRPVVEGNIRTGFGPCIEQAALFGIFANRADEGVVGNSPGDSGPGLAVIAGLVNVGMHAMVLMSVSSNVSGSGVERRARKS